MKCSIPCFIILLVVASHLPAEAQVKTALYENYIKQYSSLAVQKQKKYHIPASITLAQGLLESGAGQSELARASNNHFGIKCHTGWEGAKVYRDDDKTNECFRKYKTVEESYEDHSLFLKDRPRYAKLFTLDVTNYKAWAKGLQEYGYATNPAYANRLIKLIEDYELYRYDSGKAVDEKKDTLSREPQKKQQHTPFIIKRPVYDAQGLRFVYVKENDDFEQIAEDTGLTVKELRTYNEVPEDFPLQKGDIVYLEKKKSKANKPAYDHLVQVGESMHSISQKYGMRVKSLYRINKKKEDYVPAEGDVLKLR
jgi:LysM repeat protein